MKAFLMVAVGGACGACARLALTLTVARFWSTNLPLGTWAPNLLGCFLIGLLLPVLTRGGASLWQPLILTGFLGSFTTFSTYSIETVLLWEDGLGTLALLNALGSVVLGLAGVVAGLWVGRMVA